MKAICERAAVDFSESLLSWEPLEGLDPKWECPRAASTTNLVMGFFSKVNNSTGFADSKEREVDLEEMAKQFPVMVEDIKQCKPIYQQIIAKQHFMLK